MLSLHLPLTKSGQVEVVPFKKWVFHCLKTTSHTCPHIQSTEDSIISMHVLSTHKRVLFPTLKTTGLLNCFNCGDKDLIRNVFDSATWWIHPKSAVSVFTT